MAVRLWIIRGIPSPLGEMEITRNYSLMEPVSVHRFTLRLQAHQIQTEPRYFIPYIPAIRLLVSAMAVFSTLRSGIQRCQIARLWPYKQLGILILRRLQLQAQRRVQHL